MQARDTLWWQVYPLGALAAEPVADNGADSSSAHRLPELVGWLDHVIELGLNGLALGPIFASSTHGYDTLDHLRIDPRLGDDADFDTLVQQCRARGIALLLDGVFNHVGVDHPLFRQALQEGPGGEASEYFTIFWDRGDAAATGPDGLPDYECFEGHRQLVTLNHDSPKVVDLVAEAMIHWLDRGADGWRLDAAYAVPTAFWAQVIGRVRQRHPDCYLVGEVIHGDYAEIVAEAGMDSVTQYELWKSIWSSLNDTNLHELAWNLSRHNEFLDTFVPWTFIGNHDVTRIASKLTDPRTLPHATALLWLLPGTPAVYYGDEFGWRGVKEDRIGGDDAIRPALPTDPAHVDASVPGLPDLYRELIAVRRRHPWLHAARATASELTNGSVCLHVTADGQELILALNITDQPVTVPVHADLVAGRAQIGDRLRTPDQPGPDAPVGPISLAAFGWAVLQPSGVDA